MDGEEEEKERKDPKADKGGGRRKREGVRSAVMRGDKKLLTSQL